MAHSDSQSTAGEPGPDEGPAEVAADDPTDGAETLDPDEVFSLLKNARRRAAVRHLRAADGPVDIGDLAEAIAAEENDTTVDALTAQQRKRVYVSLYQCHLPMMADAGVVAFDRQSGAVEARERAATVAAYLPAVADAVPWWNYYLAFAVAGGALYGVELAVVGPGTPLATVTVAALVVATATVALAQWAASRRESPPVRPRGV